MKWPTKDGIRILSSNQMVARQCYVIDTQGLNRATVQACILDMREEGYDKDE